MSVLGAPRLSIDPTALCVHRITSPADPSGDPDPAADPAARAARIAHAALQSALLQVLSTYADHQVPGVLARLLAAAPATPVAPPAPAALADLSTAYTAPAFSPSDEGRAGALLLLGALLDNPALDAQRASLEAPCLLPGTPARALLDHLEARLRDEPPVDPTAPGASPAASDSGPRSPADSSRPLSLPNLLRAPAAASPTSLDGQLDFVLTHWRDLLDEPLTRDLLHARDLHAEHHAPRFGGPGPAAVIAFDDDDGAPGPARFSDDRAWMPNLVLIAKQALVWLDQLSRRYDRPITHLDHVPDAELDELAARGFTGLWLIGLWERSEASGTIKRRMGNPEAEPSAYALWDCVIAERLGGEDAYARLRDRAAARGIRLAADMVPNHVGLDSRWVHEHPDWFVHTTEPPFPGYTFDGPDLSTDPDIGIHLEDGYWDHSDAAVVFKRVDHRSGEVRYPYHGNDGTQMAWNDTAQLDYLNPEVREAVIETILEVARRASVIRFDAAMTLARKHVQRLWHPAPGTGGAIASRAERAVSPEAFDAAMPREFWREVVQRVQAEAPDTLLLAEAFWMMESTFVREFGMHRVYNSAFMHMLRDEDNAGYRASIANVLAHSPAVLERFVNFMNNPDEETAVEQFGTGDKYFGICTLLVTLPGLPMFGHGQIEGFAEKYGMEFARAQRDERPDEGLVAHHERAILPLLHQRHRFSGVEHFALFDLVRPDGSADENVFAYSNRGADGEPALVVYNNCFERTSGTLRLSAPVNVAPADAAEPRLERRTLAAALGLRDDDGLIYGLHDHRSGLWYLRRAADLRAHGLDVALDGYGCNTFLGFRPLPAHDGSWSELLLALDGAGVPDLDAAAADLAPTPDAVATPTPSATPDPDAAPALAPTPTEG